MQVAASPIAQLVCHTLGEATPGPWETLVNNHVLPYLGVASAEVLRRGKRTHFELKQHTVKARKLNRNVQPSSIALAARNTEFEVMAKRVLRHNRAFSAVHQQMNLIWSNAKTVAYDPNYDSSEYYLDQHSPWNVEDVDFCPVPYEDEYDCVEDEFAWVQLDLARTMLCVPRERKPRFHGRRCECGEAGPVFGS